MNTGTNIHLSKLESELIKNKEWILTKQSIINKVYQLFGEMHRIFRQMAENEKSILQKFYENTSAKISKGENYIGLPYVILDYPALFSKEKIFAIRTMFWWGNFFSMSLHLSGKFYSLPGDFSSIQNFLRERDFYICVNENEWQHHFEPSNYIAVAHLEDDALSEILKKKFFKISKKIELDTWNEAPEFLEKTFVELIEFIKINCLNDGRVL